MLEVKGNRWRMRNVPSKVLLILYKGFRRGGDRIISGAGTTKYRKGADDFSTAKNKSVIHMLYAQCMDHHGRMED